jgi:hypothetical protein
MVKTSVGVAFVTTGGEKIGRAVRSFRRMEPELPIHVAVDTSSNTWNTNPRLPGVDGTNTFVREFKNKFHINGTLNHAMLWMKNLKHTHVCLFHDDLIFSPLPENREYISHWAERIAAEETPREASGLSFGYMETFALNPGNIRHTEGNWHYPPHVWDAMDLESEELWKKLYVGGKPVRGEIDFPTFFVEYIACHSQEFGRCFRLGPAAQIVSVASWEAVGGFDEEWGVHYDHDYIAACAYKNLKPILYAPDGPFLHLHNQSIGYADPSVGLWGDVTAAFTKKFGKTLGEFCKEQGI